MIGDSNDRIMQDSSWADGLRGIAALYVVASHLTLCFSRFVVTPCCADDQSRTPWLFQRPIFRLIASGHSWVAVFFVLLGFVNALKPIRQARNGDSEPALMGLSTAAFRRSFRLVLPATAATVISWTLCQLGAYELSRNSDAFWLYANTPARSESLLGALLDLPNALMATWRLAEINVYDQPQWALVYLLQGSIMTFFVLLATVQLTSVWRSVTIALCAFWSWSWSKHIGDPLVGYTVFGGILLAELSISPYPAALASFSFVSMGLAPFFALAGLVLMSYPSNSPDSAPWSAALHSFFTNAFPTSAQGSVPRLVGSTGALILCLSILMSPHLRRGLAIKPLRWLGKLSFPIYLLHGTVMRTVLAWFVFAGQPLEERVVKGKNGNPDSTVMRHVKPGGVRMALGCVVMLAVTLFLSHVWAHMLEPVFGNVTAWVEKRMKRGEETVILTGSPVRAKRGEE